MGHHRVGSSLDLVQETRGVIAELKNEEKKKAAKK